jgi:hypothetical protein
LTIFGGRGGPSRFSSLRSATTAASGSYSAACVALMPNRYSSPRQTRRPIVTPDYACRLTEVENDRRGGPTSNGEVGQFQAPNYSDCAALPRRVIGGDAETCEAGQHRLPSCSLVLRRGEQAAAANRRPSPLPRPANRERENLSQWDLIASRRRGPSALPGAPISHEAQSREAEQHHDPRRRFPDRGGPGDAGN